MSDWIVSSFDTDSLFGHVTKDSKSLRFHSTSFQSDTSFRWPIVGEAVEVAITLSGKLLAVHGK